MAEFTLDNSHLDAGDGKVMPDGKYVVDGKTYNSQADYKFHLKAGTEPDAAFHVNHNAPQPSIQMVKAANIASAR